MDARWDDFVVGIFLTNLCIPDVFFIKSNSILSFHIIIRVELKERRQEVSLLQQETLQKDFKIKEMTQIQKQNESLINIKDKDEQDLKEK